MGIDPNGFLTLKKEVISIFNEKKALIGFCVLTYKRGGAVKTGPTVFLKNYQAQGYGRLFRKALEEKLVKEKMRKIYATSSTNNKPVIKYLLASHYKIEIQLSKQYGIYDELVFGKFLSDASKSENKIEHPIQDKKITARINDSKSILRIKDLVNFIKHNFSKDIININLQVSRNFLKDSFRARDLTYEDKPKTIISRVYRNKVVMSALLLPKRGGSIKCVLLSSINNLNSIVEIIKDVESFAIKAKRHRLYFTIPDYRLDIITALKMQNYKIEGMLHSPYRNNVNFIIVAKMLKD